MSKSDTWPGGVAMESLSNMDSAGSCDSVISRNSGYSEDSMEYLSAEERACLMYLEETIEALEVQEDSGLSNDEPDPGPLAETTGQITVNDVSSSPSGKDQESFLSSGIATPVADIAEEPASTALPVEGQPEHHSLNHTSEPQSNKRVLKAMDLIAQPRPPVTASAAGGTNPGQPAGIDVGVIPPPSDFMDEHPEEVDVLPPAAGVSSSKPETTVDVEELRQRAYAKKTAGGSSVTEEPPSKPPPDVTPSLSLPDVTSGPLMSPPPDTVEPRSPPAVAPKPKRLPANIILKSHKPAAPGSDGNAGHSVPTSSDRVMLDPRRVHMEALRKLGLLKSSDSDSGPVLSPKLSPKTRRSWAAPSPPVSPAAPHTPPVSPFSTHVNGPPPAPVPPQHVSPAAVLPSAPPAAPSAQSPDILPAPAAFSDTIGSLPSDNELSAVEDVTEANADTPPLTPPAMVKHLTPPKVTGIKSATLERSGSGLSSYLAHHNAGQGVSGEQSPSQLRNSRPRPASLGSGREFSSARGEAFQAGPAAGKEPESRKSLPIHVAPQPSRDSQKLPRSQGISVLICPRAENEEDRREALKKLGLLRD